MNSQMNPAIADNPSNLRILMRKKTLPQGIEPTDIRKQKQQ